MTDAFLTTSDGQHLETILDEAAEPTGVIVLCHPHPEHGGTMTAPILSAIAKESVSAGFNVLRFNFRGVGGSTGTHGGGHDELKDVDAAMAYAADLAVPIAGVAGWSFGAAVALNWLANAGSTLPYVGIAPPVNSPLTPPLPAPESLAPAQRAFVIGERDQFVPLEEMTAYAASISAEVIQYRGTDHFFVLKHKRLAEDVVRLIRL